MLKLKRIFGVSIILFAGAVSAMAQFAEAPQYATNSPAGKGPSSVAVGDFEGDSSGRDDLAVVDQTGAVSVFLNKRDGSGTFSVPPATYKVTTGASAYLIASGKFNSASQSTPDLIVADNLGNVTVLLSNGNGTFQTPTVQFSTTANFSAIVTADLNGDGIGDAVVADSQTGTAWVLTGKGGGTFSSANFQTGLNNVSQPVFLALGNVIHSKPTCPDLVAAAQDGTVAILRNSNDQHCSGGTTTLKVALVIPPDPNANGVGIPAGVTAVYAADYGGWQNTGAPTGVVDIVVASTGLSQLNLNSFPSAYLLWNSTSGGQVFFLLDTFFGQPTAQVGLTPVSMAGVDIDGDGILDLVVADQTDNSVSVLFGDGFGDLSSSPVTGGPPLVPLEFGTGFGPASVATGTFTGGTSQIGSDLVTANQTGNSVSALVNNGINVNNNNFWLGFKGTRSDYITPAFPVSVATALVQMNANCQALTFPDAIVANQSNLSPAESGLFGPFGDFSNDATGDGSFLGYNDDGSGYGIATPYSLVSADFNGDGFGDVALVDSNGLVSVFLDDVTTQQPCTANGYDLAPQSQVSVGAGASSYLLASGNFTSCTQTLSDLVVADGSGKVTVLSNAGGGNFKAQAPVPISATFSSVITGDVNGEGLSDVVAADANTGSVWIVPGTGNGGLGTPVNVATGLSKGPVFVGLAKFHSVNQTSPDLVVASQTGVVEVLTNTSSGSTISFATPVVVGAVPAGLTSILAQDFNQDGLADLVVGSTEVWLFFNTTVSGGQPTFSGPTAYVAGNVPVAMASADFNGDGTPDLAVANSIPNPSTNSNCTSNPNPLNCGSNTMTVLLNTGFFAKGVLAASPNPVQFGNPVTLTATVSGSKSTPTGQVTFYDGISQPPTNLGSANLNNGVAALVITTLTVGDHNITSVYDGDNNYPLAVSNTVLESVTLTAPILTTVNLTSSPNPSQLNSSVTFTATVTPQSGSGTPTGTVAFYSGASALGSPAMLNGGVAMLSTSALTLGTDTITAVYSGDNTFAGSTSPPLIQIVTLLPPLLTTVALQSSVNPSEVSENVTFTATVSPKSGQGIPTGTVQFMDGTTILGNSTLNTKAVANFSTTALTLGNHNITGIYSGDSQFVSSTSPVLIQKVTALLPDFGLAASPGITTLPVGSSASFTIKGTEINGFAGTIVLSCGSSAMPTGVSCAFFPNTLTIGTDGSPATSTLTIATAAAASALLREKKSLPTWGYRMGLVFTPTLFGTILLFLPKRRHLLSLCLFVLLIGGLMSQVACGAGNSSTQAANTAVSTPPGSYTVSVVGSAGATQHTTSVTLIVQ